MHVSQWNYLSECLGRMVPIWASQVTDLLCKSVYLSVSNSFICKIGLWERTERKVQVSYAACILPSSENRSGASDLCSCCCLVAGRTPCAPHLQRSQGTAERALHLETGNLASVCSAELARCETLARSQVSSLLRPWFVMELVCTLIEHLAGGRTPEA